MCASLHLDRLRLRHLRLLERIDRLRSLRAVAAELNLTQPAVSQMVKDLEQALGAELVERSSRGVALNAAGQMALHRARPGLAAFDHLAAELQEHQPPELRVGTNPAMLSGILPEAIGLMGGGRFATRFRIRTGVVSEMMRALWDGEIDCYVGRVDWDQAPSRMSGLLAHDPLCRTDLTLVCPVDHPLAGRTGIRPAELLDWPWALSPPAANNRIALDAAFRNHGLAGPAPAVEVAADPNALMTLARRANLLTCVPRLALSVHAVAAELCALEVPDLALPPVRIGFVTLTQEVEPGPLGALRRALIETVREPGMGS